MAGESEWITVDEIGYLESTCPEYQAALRALLGCKRLAAVVRKQQLPFLQQLLRRRDAFAVDLDAPYGNAGCVIMASGMGTRFGSNKLMADFRGEPLVCRALQATEGLFDRRVVVTRHGEVQKLCRELGVECSPLNILLPIPGTPLEKMPGITPADAAKAFALFRLINPRQGIKFCAGRETVMKDFHLI